MDNSEAKDNKNKTKLIICIIIIIIIILLLITSCTSSYWGKIGKVLGFTEIDITDTTNDKKVILNKDLSFEKNKYVITTDDISYKVLYILDNLRDKGVTCSTSDAEIATCVAKDGYVIVNPKKTGEVIIYAEMEANGNIYRASTSVEIKEGKTGIKLSSYEGSIYLSKGKTKDITYNLRGIKGDVKVSVDDEDIATAKVNNGVLRITGKKPGKTKITLEVEYLGRKYYATYTINVYEKPSQGGEDDTTKKPHNTTKKPGTTKPTTSSSSKLQLNITSKNMVVGDTYTIKVIKGKATTWKSSDSSIVKVDKNGKVTALKPGKVTITAKDKNGNTATVTITVTAKPTSGIKITTTSKTMKVGSTFTPAYTGGTPAKWESKDSSIASVDKNGKITAKKPGTTTITVTDTNGNKSTIKITVVPNDIKNKPIQVSKDKIDMVVGEEENIVVTQGTATSWESKDPSIASVDSNGKVTANKPGKTTIIVKDKDGNRAEVEVVVTAKPSPDPDKEIQLSTSKKEMTVGEKFKPGVIQGKPVKWESSNNNIVTVDKEGNITAVGKGKATVTAIDKDGNKAIIEITVKDLPIKVSETNITMNVGDKQTIGVIQGSASKWEVKPSGIVSVNQNGEVTALKPGKATITVTDEYGNKEIVTVTVLDPDKELSSNTNIESIKINGIEGDITSENKVGYTDEKIDLDIKLEDSNAKITHINGKPIDQVDLNNFPLNPGRNEIKVTVVAEDGTEKTHTIVITRAERTIRFSSDTDYEFDIKDAPYTISYELIEDGVVVDNLTEADIKDVIVSIPGFKGTITVDKKNPGKVIINPTPDDVGKHTINVSYNGSSDSKGLTITKPEYSITSPKYKYNASWSSDSKTTPVIINTNILSYNVDGANYDIDATTPGVILIKNKKSANDNGIVKITWDASKADIKFEKNKDGSNSYILNVTLPDKNPEDFVIDVEGSIYNDVVNSFQIEMEVTKKFVLILDAKEGVLNSLDNKIFEYLLEENKIFDLSLYEPYMVDDTKNCFVYHFIEWVDASDNTKKYNKTDKITINKDTTLNATYESESKYDEISTQSYIDLIELDLFNSINEAYEPENLIYPGLEGAHTVTINNTTDGVIKIKQFTLQEETLCVAQHQCLNMGYAIRKINPDSITNTYYYGAASGTDAQRFNILNLDPQADNDIYPTLTGKGLQGYYSNREINLNENEYIEIPAGDSVEIVILWKWVEINDELDTKIGNLAVDDNRYILNVRVGFDKTNQYCTLTETPEDNTPTTTKTN